MDDNRDERGDSDDHAQHGEKRTQLVLPQRVQSHFRVFAERYSHGFAVIRPLDFLPQRFDRTQVRGLVRRIESKKHAHGRRNTQRNDHR